VKKISLDNPFSAPVFYAETTASTMADARTLASRGEPHGSVVAAGVQDAGRGRAADRVWKAEKDQSLLFTILLRYSAGASFPQGITLRTGLALSLAIEDAAPPLKGLVRVKWPNDVMIPLPGGPGGAAFGKAAGILTEGDGGNVYIGIGVNVRQREFPADIRNKAASIALALGTVPAPGARFRLLEAFLNRLHAELEERNGSWRERLEERLYMKGRPVRFIPGAAGSGGAVEGILRGIGPGGELLIQGRSGTEPEAFVTGELEAYRH
jgi:BirA family biotin operon repressor/biotin-[acetyl-CoA-carboxylase] ligase